MRDVDNSGFNRELKHRLDSLKDKINSLTPEHINQIDSSIIRKSKYLLGNDSGVRWGDNSNVNGVEMSKVRQSISHLTRKKTEVSTISVFKPLVEDEDTRINEVSYSLPEGYNEDNTFCYLKVQAYQLDGGINRVFTADEYCRHLATLNNIYGVDSVKVYLRAYREPGKVKIRLFRDMDKKSDVDKDEYGTAYARRMIWSDMEESDLRVNPVYQILYGAIIYWRYV